VIGSRAAAEHRYVNPAMKPRSRYRLLAVLAVIGGLLSHGAWTGVSEESPNNQGGVLLASIGLLIVIYVYATSGANWLVRKLRGPAADPVPPPKPPGNIS
jgi:hypothetical protein